MYQKAVIKEQTTAVGLVSQRVQLLVEWRVMVRGLPLVALKVHDWAGKWDDLLGGLSAEYWVQ